MVHKTSQLPLRLILMLAMIAILAFPQPAQAAGPWYVATGGDDNNDCLSPATACATINSAIARASAGDTIRVGMGTYTGSSDQVVSIDKDVTLSGGWDGTFATQSGLSILDGQAARRGVYINLSITVLIDRFAIQNGKTVGNAAAGIWNFGSLTIDHSTIRGNEASTDGGGILNLGSLIVRNSSIVNNIAGEGGGLSNGSSGFGFLAMAQIVNSTISGNVADSRGGGIGNPSTGTLTLYNSTVAGNQDNFFPGSGGIYNGGGSVTLQNSIVAGNSNSNGGGMDCDGAVSSSGYNLVGNLSNCSFAVSSGDLTGVDPNLGRLIGPLDAPSYRPLLAGSPAIDAGNPSGCADPDNNVLTADQRGVPRVGNCDMGAYEYTTAGPAASLSVVGGDHQSTTATLAFPQPLQAAALDSQGSPVSGVTIDFTAPASGPSGTFADTGTNTTSANTGIDGVATTSVLTANDLEGVYSVTAAAAGLGPVTFSLEQITRPTNDNFANAKAITTLPFNDSLDSTKTTLEPGEPQVCGSTPQTQSVWYSFTPVTNVAMSADMLGSSFSDMALTIYRSVGPGFNGLNMEDRACFGGSINFVAQAGVTYYFQAESISSGGGDLHLNVNQIPPPANDNFADATPIMALPFDDTVNMAASTIEANEPGPTCLFNSLIGSVWYAFTPSATESVTASASSFPFSIPLAVYTGNSLSNLTRVACQASNQVTFHADAGVTYYIQAGVPAFSQGGSTQFHLDIAQPPMAGFFYFPNPPSSFDTIQFVDSSNDPGQAGLQTFMWNFGDGATSTDLNPTHKYAADGDYLVEHSITTVDGRSASTSQTVSVRTHDVSITKITAPTAASSGQTKAITVSLRTTRYAETVTVDLYRSTSTLNEWIGSVTLPVPVARGNKTTQFTFNYTFTSQDARIGKVTFQAVATINGANDAFPQDNTAVSSPPTRVNR